MAKLTVDVPDWLLAWLRNEEPSPWETLLQIIRFRLAEIDAQAAGEEWLAELEAELGSPTTEDTAWASEKFGPLTAVAPVAPAQPGRRPRCDDATVATVQRAPALEDTAPTKPAGRTVPRRERTIPSAEEEPVIAVPRAGRLMGLGRSSSYDAARRGELPTLRFGGRLVVPTAALRQMLGLDQDSDA